MSRCHGSFLSLLAGLLVLGGLCGWVAVATGRASGPPPGERLAPVDLPLVKGATPRFSLAQARGRPLVIEIFASWCAACQKASPILADAARARRARETRFVAVSVDDSPFLAAVAARRWAIPYDVAFDDRGVADVWEVTRLPTVIVVDAQGRVSRVVAGVPSASEVERWLDEVGAGRLD